MSHGNQQRQIYSRWAQRNDPVQLDIGPEEMAFAKRDPVLWRSMVKIFSAVNSMQRQLRDMDPGIIDSEMEIGPDGKIMSRLVNTTGLVRGSMDIGGGRNRLQEIRVYNSTGTQIGFIGVEGSIQGAWFKEISIGGTSFATGKLKADSSGNVTLIGGGVTITDATFELTLNGIRTSIKNEDITGVGITGLRVNDTTLPNQMSVITQSFIAIYDRDQNLAVSIARSAGDPPGAGLVRVTNGTGTGELGSGQRIILEGDTGKVRCNGEVSIEGSQSTGGGFLHFNQTEGAAAGAGTTFGYVTVKFQGEQRKIQLFNL